MSLIKYILQSCDGNLKYRVNFTGATSLNVGEIWYVECGGIDSGCYVVTTNTDETLDEYNSDECTFIEFDDCDGCESTFGEQLVGPETYTVQEYVQNCYQDNRDFTDPTLSNGGTDTAIWLRNTEDYWGSEVIYFRNNDTEELKCFGRKGGISNPVTTNFYTNNVTPISGYTDCDECYSACTAQDIIIYLNPKFDISASPAASELMFNAMKQGLISLIESMQEKINQGIVKIGIFKAPTNCTDVGSVIGLSESYNNILSAIVTGKQHPYN